MEEGKREERRESEREEKERVCFSLVTRSRARPVWAGL